VPVTRLLQVTAPDSARFRGIERIKDFLTERGFTEISTQTFATNGDVVLANPLDQTKPALRTSLSENMQDALKRATYAAPRVLGPVNELRLFEIGTIYAHDSEQLALCLGYQQLAGKRTEMLADVSPAFADEFGIELDISNDIAEAILAKVDLEKLGESYKPRQTTLGAYHPFSQYPFALRDVAVWTPIGTEEDEVENVIIKVAGDLLARIDLFDTFEKEGRTSFAFRLVFESFERTLSDDDLNPLMQKITDALNGHKDWEVR
jgi:phenylalanyl-tRNA synthetase beta subunit